jgi:hypothetical protein
MARRMCLLAACITLWVAGVSAQKPRVNPDAQTIADFMKRVNDYVALHKKLEGTLPPLPKQTNPTEVDQHERALAKLIQQDRADAKQGDIFTPEMQELIRRLLRPIFRGPGSKSIRAEILDNEYKGNVALRVNGRYPDEVPLSTVPPQVLKALPKLPEDLEYRFIQLNLILLDPHAHLIADYIPRSFH